MPYSELLKACSDDELLEELKKRGRVQTMVSTRTVSLLEILSSPDWGAKQREYTYKTMSAYLGASMEKSGMFRRGLDTDALYGEFLSLTATVVVPKKE